MSRNKTILVVDDDPHIRDVIGYALKKAAYEYDEAAEGRAAVDKAEALKPDLIILDIGLPEMDGLEVCRHIRKASEVPILFLSARDEEVDRIIGLEIGGDDYVTKPFSPRELIARIGVILKRYDAGAKLESNPSDEILTRGALELERQQHRIEFAGHPVALTAIEFNILAALLARPQMVFTREQILQASYKDNIHVSDRTIDSHIRNIRGKLAKAGCADVVETVHGVGFRLGACSPSPD